MIYKVLWIIFLTWWLIEAAPPRKSGSNVNGQLKHILVFDDVEDSVPENLEDLEVRTGTSGDESQNGFPGYSDDLMVDPLALDTSRNPSPRPDINEGTTQKSQNISNSENHQNAGNHSDGDHLQGETITETIQEQIPDSDEPLNSIRKVIFKIIDHKTRIMKEGMNSMLEAGKNIFNSNKKPVDPFGFFRLGWNFFGNFGDKKTSGGSAEFEEFSLS